MSFGYERHRNKAFIIIIIIIIIIITNLDTRSNFFMPVILRRLALEQI